MTKKYIRLFDSMSEQSLLEFFHDICKKRKLTKTFLNNLNDFYKIFILVNINYIYITYMSNPSDVVKIAVLKEAGHMITHIKNPSEELQLIAVKQNANAIKFIKDPSEKIQLVAVKKDGRLIRFIKNPSEKVQLAAIKENENAI